MKAPNKTTFGNIKRVSLVDQVVAAVKKAIIDGEVRHGERIVEARLAATFHIGHPTVREALIELEHQGFITRHRNRGTFVSNSNPTRDAEVYAVREELELLAVRLARARMEERDLTRVEGHLEAMEQAARAFDRVAFVDADLSFHRAIWALSGNECLVDTLERLTAPFIVAAAARSAWTALDQCLEVLASHRFYFRSLTAGSDEKAAEIVRETFAKFRASYQRTLPKTEKDQGERRGISAHGPGGAAPHHLEWHGQVRATENVGPRELGKCK